MEQVSQERLQMRVGGSFWQVNGHIFHEIQPLFFIQFTVTIVRRYSSEELVEDGSNRVEVSCEIVVLVVDDFWCHVRGRATNGSGEVVLFKIAFTESEVTDPKMSIDINKYVFRFEVAVQYFAFVNVLHGQQYLTEIVAYLEWCRFVARGTKMEEEFAPRIVVHQEIEVVFGLETGVQVGSVRVVAHAHQVLPFSEQSHQLLVGFNATFRHSFQSQYCSAHSATHQKYLTACSSTETHQKLKFTSTQSLASSFTCVETSQFQTLFTKAREVHERMCQPIVEKRSCVDTTKTNESTSLGSVLLMKRLVSFHHCDQSPDSGVLGQ